MTGILRFRSNVLINFRNFDFESSSTHGFRWVNVKEFELLDTSADSPDVLQSLIEDEAFRDDYSGGGIDPSGERHGPYWLSMVQPASFEEVDTGRAVDILSDWSLKYGSIPPALRRELDKIAYGPIYSSDVCFLLKDLGESAVHDYGRIQIDFYEFVTVQRGSRLVNLIVAADD